MYLGSFIPSKNILAGWPVKMRYDTVREVSYRAPYKNKCTQGWRPQTPAHQTPTGVAPILGAFPRSITQPSNLVSCVC